MTVTKNCPKCGAELPVDAPGGICPQCLIREGLENTVDLDESGGTWAGSDKLPEPGEQFGTYRIGRLLGKGGMGAVYDAEHTESGRRVALKILSHKLQSTEHRHRFLREGRLAASINHPNNVYIFGTDEIDGVPVIAMELAAGGTLQERVKRDGPLPVGEAVDVILEIIAGLEAAEAAGVLHRDIKPSNCFLDADGTVKVGDFGLSISTAPRVDTNLTQSGVVLGTPAFSSPEQLRGDELDVRSDIYSVGVTLYYLLTGQMPFRATQMVQLLATVLEQPAPSPKSLRTEVPPGLAKVVLRCLAKQKSHRFKTYDELRQALLPFASAAPTPGTLGFRVLASVIDFVVLDLIGALLPLLWAREIATWQVHFDVISEPWPQANSVLMLLAGLGMLLSLSYFAVLEGIWGAAIGKAICRLRVVRADRENAGVPRALLRATILCASGWLPVWLLYAYNSDAAIAANLNSDFWILVAVSLIAGLLLFTTMRRRNGFAGLHELASGTRVVRTGTRERRPALSLADDPPPEIQQEQRIGPYHVLSELDCGDANELRLAYDTRLLRKVWIRTSHGEAPPVASKLRELARIGRLRWLNGERSADGSWDAYEAPTGKPFLTLIDAPQPWNAVRFWLSDLAEELNTSLNDLTVPPVLDLDRIWITADGRAKLLDFPAPGLDAQPRLGAVSPSPASDPPTVADFLKCVAVAALEGDVLSSEEVRDRNVSVPIPVPARNLLNDLGGTGKATLPTVELESLTRRPASVSLGRRVGALAACWLIPILMTAYTMTIFFAERQFLRAHPDVGELSGFVDYYQSLEKPNSRIKNAATIDRLREAVEIVVVDRFRSTITDAELWSDPTTNEFVSATGRRLLAGFVKAHPDLSPEQVDLAQVCLLPVMDEIHLRGWDADDDVYTFSRKEFLLMVSGILAAFVILPSLISAVLFGNTLLLQMLEIAVVTKNGAPASRLRLLCRNAILWSIALLAIALLTLSMTGRPRMIGILIVGGVINMFTAERGLHDRLAGTWLVPR